MGLGRSQTRTAFILGVLAFAVAMLGGCMTVPPDAQLLAVAPSSQMVQFASASIPIADNVSLQLQPAQYLGSIVVSASNVTIYGSGIDTTYIVGDVLITGDDCTLAALTVTGNVMIEGANANVAGAQVDGEVAYQGPNYVMPAEQAPGPVVVPAFPFQAPPQVSGPVVVPAVPFQTPPHPAVVVPGAVVRPGMPVAPNARPPQPPPRSPSPQFVRPQPQPPRLNEPPQRGQQPVWREQSAPPQAPPPRIGPPHQQPQPARPAQIVPRR